MLRLTPPCERLAHIHFQRSPAVDGDVAWISYSSGKRQVTKTGSQGSLRGCRNESGRTRLASAQADHHRLAATLFETWCRSDALISSLPSISVITSPTSSPARSAGESFATNCTLPPFACGSPRRSGHVGCGRFHGDADRYPRSRFDRHRKDCRRPAPRPRLSAPESANGILTRPLPGTSAKPPRTAGRGR